MGRTKIITKEDSNITITGENWAGIGNGIEVQLELAKNIIKEGTEGTFGITPIELANNSGAGATGLIKDTDYIYGQPLDGSGTAPDIWDDAASGALTGKIRIVHDGKNVTDPTGLNLTPIAMDLTSTIDHPQNNEIWVDPKIGKFRLPKVLFHSKLENYSNLTTPEYGGEYDPDYTEYYYDPWHEYAKPYGLDYMWAGFTPVYITSGDGSAWLYGLWNGESMVINHRSRRSGAHMYFYGNPFYNAHYGGFKPTLSKGCATWWGYADGGERTDDNDAYTSTCNEFWIIHKNWTNSTGVRIAAIGDDGPDFNLIQIFINGNSWYSGNLNNPGSPFWTTSGYPVYDGGHFYGIAWDFTDDGELGSNHLVLYRDNIQIFGTSISSEIRSILLGQIDEDPHVCRFGLAGWTNNAGDHNPQCGEASAKMDNIKIWNDVVDVANKINKDNFGANVEGLSTIYDSGNNYKPGTIEVGYYYISTESETISVTEANAVGHSVDWEIT